jgi:hypothetical protein
VNSAVADPAAFRTVFAAPGELLVVALVDRDQGEELAGFSQAVKSLRLGGTAVKLVVFGDTRAILPEPEGIGFLEPWARPVLAELLCLADVVIPLAKDSGALLSGHSAPIVSHPEELREVVLPRRIAAGKRLLLQNGWGIGDELLLSAVAREIVRAHPETKVWIRSRHGFRFPSYVESGPPDSEALDVETIYQNAVLYGPGHHSPFPGHLVQQMLDKVALDTGIKVIASDVRPELSVPSVRRTEDPTVLLHSGTNPRLPSKDWGLARWEALARNLRSSGIRVRQVGGREETLLAGAEDLRGTAPGELGEIFAESWAAVSVVGFLMHLAEAVRTPAVVIYGGREHPAIDGYPDQVHLSSGPLACRGRWGCHLAPDHECPNGMKCMEALTPELVAREVLSVLRRARR